MDAQPKRRRLLAFLKHTTVRPSSPKTDLRLSDDPLPRQTAEVAHGPIHDEKKESRLSRFGRGIRRWRARRTKSHGESQLTPHVPLPQLAPSEGSSPVHDVPPQTSQEEIIAKESGTDQTISQQEVVIQETILARDVENLEPTVQEEVPRKQETTPYEVTQDAAVQRQGASQQMFPAEKECIAEPTTKRPLPLPKVYSPLFWSEISPQATVARDRVVVFMRDKRHAHDFAKSISDDKRVFWTDASHRYLEITGGDLYHHGGIAVAHRLNTNQWRVHSAHVTGLPSVSDLEKLAILLALQRAVQDREVELRGNQDAVDERPVFKVCSDSMSALTWLEKAICVGIAVRRAAQELEASADDTGDLGGLLALSAELDRCGAFRFGDYSCPEKTFTTSIGRRTLEEYYKLCKLGTVEFHWVPAHKGLLGNEIADKAASSACLWYASVAPRLGLGVGLVLPLEVREARGRWKPGPRPTDTTALQTLEGAKDLWVVLTLKSSREAMTVHTEVKPRTISSPDGVRSMKHLLSPPPSCARGAATSGPVPVSSGDATSTAVRRSTERLRHQQYNTALKPMFTADPGPPVSFAGPQPAQRVPGLAGKQKKSTQRQRGGKRPETREACSHCGGANHVAPECFERFPEQKQTRPRNYSKWSGRRRLEKTTPGAFSLMSRLHPRLKGVSCRGDSLRYMLGGGAGFSHDLTSLSAHRTVKFPVKRGGAAFPVQMALQYRQFLLAKYEWPQ